MDTTKTNGTVDQITIGAVAPSGAFAQAYDCDVQSIQVTTFGYIGDSGLVESPSNVGPLTSGQGIDCGKVMVITARGTPPTFTIQVF
jgi:hypothetical protein